MVIGHSYGHINNAAYAIGYMCYCIYLYIVCVIEYIYIRYVLLNNPINKLINYPYRFYLINLLIIYRSNL